MLSDAVVFWFAPYDSVTSFDTEDDCVPEVGFFRYCDLMLKKFKRNKDIAHISGCNLYYGSKKKKNKWQRLFFF